jgi:hypothetical protein
MFGTVKSDKLGNFTVPGFTGRIYQFGVVLFEREPRSFYDSPGKVMAAGESGTFVLEATTPQITIKIDRTDEAQKLLDKYVGVRISLSHEHSYLTSLE